MPFTFGDVFFVAFFAMAIFLSTYKVSKKIKKMAVPKDRHSKARMESVG
jgi:hypothetical protein